MPKVVILGAGAIGQLLYWQLQPLTPQLLGRRPTPPRISYQHLNGHIEHQAPRYLQLTQGIDADTDLLIVSVKAHQVTDALLPLLPELPSHCAILLLHNGMGPHLDVAAHTGTRPLLLGTTSQGALRQKSWFVRHTGHGITHIGQYTGVPLSQTIRHSLLRTLPDCHWQADILTALWQKLAVNCAINPLTALHQCPNGALAAAEFQQQIISIISELQQVAAAEGLHFKQNELLARINQVINLTANNQSSMLQDCRHHRQTEINAINGYVVDRAIAHGLTAPLNHDLVQRILALSPSSEQLLGH